MGLPLILSSACGAATEFLIHGYNGYLFKGGGVPQLAQALDDLFSRTDNELRAMGDRSRILAGRISSQTAAANLCSVIGQ